MITRDHLIALVRQLRDHRVLSVYLSRRVDNPAERRTWQTHLAHDVRELDRLVSQRSRAEHKEFERARQAIEREMTETDFDPLHAAGIVIFATADGVRHRDTLPFHVPVSVQWRNGIAVAPYVRALKEERPVVVALVDGMQARVFDYRLGTLHLAMQLSVEPHTEGPQHMGAPATRMHHGVHGATGKDEAQHRWNATTDRMLHELRDALVRHVEPGAWLLVGGREDVARHARALLPTSLAARCAPAVGLAVTSVVPLIANEARAGASRLRNAADRRALTALESIADSGPAARGAEKTFHALYDLSVAELYVSEGYLALHPDDAEDAMRRALDQGADVETVTAAAALKLDRMGGIAARLRYAAPVAAVPTRASTTLAEV